MMSFADHRERQLLHHLRSGRWASLHKLPVPAGKRLLLSLLNKGWIERRDSVAPAEIRLTGPGFDALRAPVPL